MNKSSFDIFSKVQDVSVNPENITGTFDGLRSFLNVFISVVYRPPSKELSIDVIAMSAKLKLQHPGTLLSEVVLPVGQSIPREEYSTGEWFNFVLDEPAMHTIEKSRTGDIQFIIELTVVTNLKSHFNSSSQKIIKSLDQVHKGSTRLSLVIPRSVWVEKILPGTGFKNLKLIEIPVTHRSLKEAYQDIVFEFNKAEEYFNQQDYNKCIAHCRHTLDALTRNLKKIKEQQPSETAFKWLEKIDNATFSWIDELNKSNAALTSKTHHSGHKRDFSKHEAESVYLVTLGLLNFIGHMNRV